MTAPLPTGSVIGIIGGGQLGMMTIREAQRMGFRSAVWDPDPDCPASRLADDVITAPFDDASAAARLAEKADAITYEFEHISVELVRSLEAKKRVRPGHDILRVAQHREVEKTSLRSHGIPVAKFRVAETAEAVRMAIEEVGLPVVVKTSSAGYDGKGQSMLRSSADAERFLEAYAASPVPVVVETFLDLEAEVSVIAIRDAGGRVQEFPVVQNEHRDHILHLSVVPAQISDQVRRDALHLARRVVEGLDVVGVLCVEMFVTRDGTVLVNEIAPRPHNSGHFSLDACSISQFEALVRVVAGLDIPEPELSTPCAMVNLLGKHVSRLDVAQLHRIPGTKLHLYGKLRNEPKRKMGHVTILGASEAVVRERMERVRTLIGEPNS
ncbi:MAG: 5-(carboxyamino)imidazole ribonucleotide synthase [Bacteroidetes bacterium]|jgi:5-(carboxyamino)imidazole ribonucleotide synthase|nr:5-(carboxyamino)imidazole ribonucleotide synthase [Bacteroidota bacterium]